MDIKHFDMGDKKNFSKIPHVDFVTVTSGYSMSYMNLPCRDRKQNLGGVGVIIVILYYHDFCKIFSYTHYISQYLNYNIATASKHSRWYTTKPSNHLLNLKTLEVPKRTKVFFLRIRDFF